MGILISDRISYRTHYMCSDTEFKKYKKIDIVSTIYIVLGGGRVIVKGYPIEKESIKVQSTRKIVR